MPQNVFSMQENEPRRQQNQLRKWLKKPAKCNSDMR
jgi:hypothetical protein